MTLRYVILRADYESYHEDFFNVFMDNVRFISNYLSRMIRMRKCETDGTFNMISISITQLADSCTLSSEKVLEVKVHFSNNSMDSYLNIKDEKTRFNFYLSILEKGYAIASNYKNIPYKHLLELHQDFRNKGFQNIWLFKTKQIKQHAIRIELFHNLSSYDYRLEIFVYNHQKILIGKGVIFKTFPDELLFDKNVRHLVIENDELIITDFLNKPQFVCRLADLSKGVIKSECVDEHTQKYIYNEQNASQFERLKWK